MSLCSNLNLNFVQYADRLDRQVDLFFVFLKKKLILVSIFIYPKSIFILFF